MTYPIEGYPATNKVQRLTGKVDYGDQITTQLWKRVDNLSALFKTHVGAGGSNGLCGPNNPHGIGITRYTFSIPVWGAMERNVIEEDISNKLAFGMALVEHIADSGGIDCSSMTVTGSPTADQQRTIHSHWTSDMTDGEPLEGVCADNTINLHFRAHNLMFYTGYGMTDEPGTDPDPYTTGGWTTTIYSYTGIPVAGVQGFVLGRNDSALHPDFHRLLLWKDPSSGYLKLSSRVGADDMHVVHGFFDLTNIPNSGYGKVYALTGLSSVTAHAHYCDSYVSDGTTDGIPTTHAFYPNQTQVFADGLAKVRGYDYYEEAGYQSVKFGGTIPASVHVIVTYPY